VEPLPANIILRWMRLVLTNTQAYKNSFKITNIYVKSLSIKEVTGNNYDLNAVLMIVCLPICRLTEQNKNYSGAA
jgi:hypothetical protein